MRGAGGTEGRMLNVHETSPHEAYLDAVFARINRLRTIDAAVLTERYGVDPAVLDPIASSKTAWPTSQMLAEAEAEREELHEHLEGLVREFVADGLGHDAAVLEAQRILGEPEELARQISASTGQAVLGVDGRWLPFLRRNNVFVSFAVLVSIPLTTCLAPSYSAIILSFSGCISFIYGLFSGYSYGLCISTELRLHLENTERELRSLLLLPTIGTLNARQRLARLNLKRNVFRLRRIHDMANPVEMTVRNRSRQFILDASALVFLIWMTAKSVHGMQANVAFWGMILAFNTFTFARDLGIRLGSRVRNERLLRRAS